MSLDRQFFFDHIRQPLFDGSLKQSQVDNLGAILDSWDATQAGQDLRWLAYALATAHHETDQSFGPIAEYGHGKGRPYGVPDPQTHQTYYGRGLVQLTWKKNYQTMSDLIGVDLVHNPDLALQLKNAIPIMFVGMEKGLFTGKKLGDYFHGATSDWVNARRIINGLDRAQTIAGYAQSYFAALKEAP